MSLLRRTATHLLPAVTGAIVSVVVLVALPIERGMSSRSNPADEVAATPEPDLGPGLSPSRDIAFEDATARRDSLRNRLRLAALEARLDEALDGERLAPDDPESEAEVVPEADLEQERERVFADWREKLDLHAREVVDEAWSAEVTPSFRTDLSAIAGGANPFETLAVECLSVTCSATLQYPSFGNAVSGFRDLLHHRYEENCASEVVLPDPEDPGAPYVATVLYDCTEAKSQRLAALQD